MSHIPVMLDHVVEHLAPSEGNVLLDGTFGGGGYTRRLLAEANCRVLGVDRDPDALKRADDIVASYGDRFTLLPGCFGDLDRLALGVSETKLDGVVLDLGVSSFQLDQADRGFSFMRDGPLDMRMSRTGPNAADIVNSADERDLADIIFQLGEERESRRIARSLVQARKATPFETTLQLADAVENAVGGRRGKKTHPATKTFQALRMFVNDELGELARGLCAAERALKASGRLVIVTFHSLEDRMVKTFFADRSGKTEGGSRFMPQVEQTGPAPSFETLRRVTAPDTAEIATNVRARSSRLRSGIRTDSPAWDVEIELPVNLPDLTEFA
ncbi:MAG: 16S rRNA (cytosine(1402)-N(4))-methyltransferase [Ponticaulis sp.]|nr:16S rRNA (cytosine(1402)-N(4))-methyltransferase [Ponticaulis sp.]|tara:strand:- start:62121 stop:63107 length:987 start_codon:yes stop_codon:yes gene_type:complete